MEEILYTCIKIALFVMFFENVTSNFKSGLLFFLVVFL